MLVPLTQMNYAFINMGGTCNRELATSSLVRHGVMAALHRVLHFFHIVHLLILKELSLAIASCHKLSHLIRGFVSDRAKIYVIRFFNFSNEQQKNRDSVL